MVTQEKIEVHVIMEWFTEDNIHFKSGYQSILL